MWVGHLVKRQVEPENKRFRRRWGDILRGAANGGIVCL